MSLADNLLVNALVQRARQESQAMTQGRLGLGPDPNQGPGLNLGRGAGVALAPLHALGMAMEAGSTVGKLGTGTTAALLGALRRAQEGRYGSTVNAVAQTVPVVGAIASASEAGRHMGGLDPLQVGPFHRADAERALAAFMAQPGPAGALAANEQLAHTNRFASGAANELLNPINWGGTIARSPGLLGKAGTALNAVNEAPALPLRALLAAKRGVPVGDELARALGLAAPAAQSPELAAAAADFASKASQRAPIPPRGIPDPLAQGPLRRGQTTLDPTQLPSGPTLPPVVGPPRPGRRVVPETALPDISYRPGNVPGRTPIGPALPPELGPQLPPEQGPALPTTGNVPRNLLELIGRKRQLGPPVPPAGLPSPTAAVGAPQLPPTYGRETFTLGNPLQLQETAQRLGIQQPAPQTVEDLRAAFAGLQTPAPAVPPATAAVSAPTPPSTVADLGGNVSREAVIQATANRPPNALTPTLRSLHNAVYPGGQADFAIPRLTGVNARDFRTSLLTDHPTGNVAEQYLDYLVSRVQTDAKAAARLGAADPDLLADVMALPPHPTPVNEQKVALQQRLGAGKFREVQGAEATVLPGGLPAARTVPPGAAGPAGALDTPVTGLPATRADFDALLTGPWSSSRYVPEADAFAKRLGVPLEQARQWIDEAISEGTLRRMPTGDLTFAPQPRANPALPSDVRARIDAAVAKGTVTPIPLEPPVVPEPRRIPVAYHGTRANFDQFRDPLAAQGQANDSLGRGIYFTDSPELAAFWSRDNTGNAAGGRVMTGALTMRNPLEFDMQTWRQVQTLVGGDSATIADRVRAAGHDGIIFHQPNGRTTYVVYDPAAIGAANPAHDITTPPPLSNVDIAPEATPRPSTVEPLPPPAAPPGQPSAGELLRRYRERWPEGTPVAPEAVPPVEDAVPKPVKGTVAIEVHEGPRGTVVKREVPGTIYGDLAITPSLSNPKRYNVTEIATGTTLNTGKPLALKEAQSQMAEYLGIGQELNISTQTRDGLTAIGLVRSARRIGRELTPFEQSFIERAKNPTPGGDIAAGGGGGGGLGLVSTLGRNSLSGVGAMTGIAGGGTIGGLLPADSEEQRQENIRRGRIIGGVAGGALGLAAGGGDVGNPDALGIIRKPFLKAATGQVEARTPAQQQRIANVMATYAARGPEDERLLQGAAQQRFAEAVPGGDVSGLFAALLDRIPALKTISLGFGDMKPGQIRKIADSGQVVNGFQLHGAQAGQDIPASLLDAKAAGIGMNPGSKRYDEAVHWGALHGIMDPGEAVRAYSKHFLTTEGGSFGLTGGGNPLTDADAVPQVYAQIGEGQPAGGQMGGPFHILYNPSTTPYVATLSHPFGVASPDILPMHEGTAPGLLRYFGRNATEAFGRPATMAGQGGVTISGTPTFTGPGSADTLRATALILSATDDVLARAASDPEGVALQLLRGETLQQRGLSAATMAKEIAAGKNVKPSQIYDLAGVSSAKRSEAMILDPSPQHMDGLLIRAQTLPDQEEYIQAARYFREKMGRPDLPIYVARGQEGTPNPGVMRVMDDGTLQPATLAQGRAGLVSDYTARGMQNIGAVSPVVNRAGEAIGGALAGGAIGGAAGLTQGDTPAERKANALKGAGLGLAVGGNVGYASPELLAAARQIAPAVAQRLGGAVIDPEMQMLTLRHAWEAQKAAPETAGVRGLEAFPTFWRQWGRQVVHNLKQFSQDAITRLTTLAGVAEKEFPGTGARIPFWQKGLVQERAGQQSFLNNPVTSWFRDTGHADLIPLHGDIVGAEGTDVALAPQGKQFGGLGRAISGGLMSAWTGNPIAMAYGAARGYAAPFVDAYVGLLNGAQHDALRFGMLESALDRDMPTLADTFLADLRSRGVDTATLDGLGGRFSAADVDALAPGAGRDWADASEFLIRANGDRIAFLSGDFRDKLAPGYTGKVTTLDKVVGRALKGLGPLAPFVQWQIRYTPVLAEIAARNPVATRLTLAAMAQGGTVDISTETPVLGAAARVRLSGQAGTVKVNPFAAVTPYSPESVNQAPELPEDATLYQRATNLGGKVGIRPHPLIQALAYVGGQDYRAPSSLSRTAGLEGLADIPLQLAGVPNGPGVRGALDAGRQLLSPVTGAGIPQSDPTATRYAELVLRTTGRPLSDPSNRGYMETIGERDNPLWVRALLESRGLAAAGNATGMAVPVPVTARSQEGLAAKAAPKLPVTIGQIRAAPSSDRAALLDAYQRAAASSPASATYAGTNSKDRRFILVQRWESEHQAMKRMAPQLYADRRAAYAESLR